MTLTDYKSELAKTVSCEISALKRGNLECANKMMAVRHGAQIRVFIIECLLEREDADFIEECPGLQSGSTQAMINYLYEQVKEMTRFITTDNCIGSPCS